MEKNRIKFTVAENNDKKRNKQRWVGQEKNSKIVIKSCHLILHYYREFLQTAHKRLTCASPFILIVNVFLSSFLLFRRFYHRIKTTFDFNSYLYKAFKQHGYTKTLKQREAGSIKKAF